MKRRTPQLAPNSRFQPASFQFLLALADNVSLLATSAERSLNYRLAGLESNVRI
ncbi:MAG: hypothetical protein ACE145_18700 [Terriglobia bacterium]